MQRANRKNGGAAIKIRFFRMGRIDVLKKTEKEKSHAHIHYLNKEGKIALTFA